MLHDGSIGPEGVAFRSFVQTVRKSKLLKDGEEVSDPMDREVRVIMIPLMPLISWQLHAKGGAYTHFSSTGYPQPSEGFIGRPAIKKGAGR